MDLVAVKDFLKGLKKGFGLFAPLLADAVNLVLLFIVYIVGVGVVSIIAKIFGKRFLNLHGENGQSFWLKAEKGIWEEKSSFYRMF